MALQLHVKIVEASHIHKVHSFSKTDPYCVLTLTPGNETRRTKVLFNKHTPVWKEEYHFTLMNPAQTILTVIMYDRDPVADDVLARLQINVYALPLGRVFDEWYPISPGRNLRKGGDLHLCLQIAPAGAPPFVPTSVYPSPPPLAYPSPRYLPPEYGAGYPVVSGYMPPGYPIPSPMGYESPPTVEYLPAFGFFEANPPRPAYVQPGQYLF
jgi:hypothetical protein